MRGRALVVWNVLKAWLLLAGGCAVLAAIGWALGDLRLMSLLVFFGLLVAGGSIAAFLAPSAPPAATEFLVRMAAWCEQLRLREGAR